MKSAVAKCWSNFLPHWIFCFMWTIAASIFLIERYYRDYPVRTWSLFFAFHIISVFFIKFTLAKVGRAMTGKPNGYIVKLVLFVVPSFLFVIVGGAVGFWLRQWLE